jgi:3-hydroxyacyl-CoA dehydrogenase/enoyl-CoA hydratase/3-hydroxybutyryl-CoA epimerase
MNGTVILSFSSDNLVATITLGAPDERAITLTPARLRSFVEAIHYVRSSPARGLVIRAPSVESFCVGADISLIQSVTDPTRGAELAAEGQRAYDLLEDLPIATVAAIGGPCVGGGCEMVLACKHRIISDSPSSAIGLPETKLGILPGFGGTYRMPRVVGLPKALDIILAGKTLKAQQALKASLVDEIVSPDKLEERAEQIARGEKVPRRRPLSLTERLLTSNPLGRSLVRRNASRALMKQTKGFYPAPPRALDLAIAGLSRSRLDGMAHEAQALGKLIVTPESKALVHLFFLTEASKGLGKRSKEEIKGAYSLVVGAGTMGAGIAGALARASHQVIVKDTSEGALKRGKDHLAKEFGKLRYLSSFERAAALNRIDWLQFPSDTIGRSDVVIEAVFEDMALKKRIFSDLAARVSHECILASNTSSLSVTEMAKGLPHPERCIGMHFFNPVEKMPLVEIIRGHQTSEETISKIAALTTEIGKFPIVVNDVPGFLVNRILIPYLNEAVFLLQEGYSIEEIDGAALDFGMPMGPIRLLDEVGLDVAAHVSKIMVAGYGDRMAVPAFAETLMNLGRKGRKSNAGFFDYKGKSSQPWEGLRQALGLPQSPAHRLTRAEITERLIVHLVNEAMKCLHENVAGEDKELAKKQIDLGTVMGIGFPPFRGGVLYYAEQRGLDAIRGRLVDFEGRYGSRYTPFEADPGTLSPVVEGV